jgi:hypothetical protein
MMKPKFGVETKASVIITINNTKHELTLDEARQLRAQLDEAIGNLTPALRGGYFER